MADDMKVTNSHLAVIDFSPICVEKDTIIWEHEVKLAETLKMTLLKNGYFCIVNHGISKELMDDIHRDSKSFFEDLTEEEKFAALPADSKDDNGFMIRKGMIPTGVETDGVRK